MDATWTWELPGYCVKYGFLAEPKGLTMREVERIFQLDPEPPVLENMNDYIIEAVHSRDLRCFPFFCTTMRTGSMDVFAVSCCGRDWIAMTRNAFWTTKWAVCLPCWIVSGNTIPHKEQIF